MSTATWKEGDKLLVDATVHMVGPVFTHIIVGNDQIVGVRNSDLAETQSALAPLETQEARLLFEACREVMQLRPDPNIPPSGEYELALRRLETAGRDFGHQLNGDENA